MVTKANIEKLITALNESGLFAPGCILTGDAVGADYGKDEYPGSSYIPDVVIMAKDTQQVSAVLKACHELSIPVTPRGAGTGQAGGCVAVNGGVVLAMSGMNAIISSDAAACTMRVQAGVLLSDVKAEADRLGLYYPPDPGEKTATIGGNAATDAAGPCAAKYGTTRSYINGGTAVLSDGSIVDFSCDESTSPFIGSEGTLAVITELELRLIDKPGAEAILLFPFMDAESCIKAAETISAQFSPAVAEYMDTDIVEFAGKVTGNPVFPVEMDGERVGATLMVTLEGEDDDDVMAKMEEIAEMAEELECLDILVGDTPTMMREFWSAHDAFHTAMESGAAHAVEYNITVPAAHLAQLVDYAKAEGEALSLKVMAYAHVMSGGLHLHAAADCGKDAFAAAAAELGGKVYAKCVELGGSIRGEYGIGYAKTKCMSDGDAAGFAAAKAKYDAAGILNPGKAAITC